MTFIYNKRITECVKCVARYSIRSEIYSKIHINHQEIKELHRLTEILATLEVCLFDAKLFFYCVSCPKNMLLAEVFEKILVRITSWGIVFK